MNQNHSEPPRTPASQGQNRPVSGFDGTTYYRAAIGHLKSARIPFLVGGAYALEVYAGIIRRTKDFDIFLLEEDVGRCLHVLAEAGYRTELTFPHWLGKAYCGEEFIDVIFSSGNGVCRVDREWFHHCGTGNVLGIDLELCPVEEILWQKAFILERDRCDVADVAHLLRQQGDVLDWNRLLDRFGDLWRVLQAQILLFDFIYPGHRSIIPGWVRSHLRQRDRQETPARDSTDRACYGTLLSASQYLRDIDLDGYHDVRLPPTGDLTSEQIAVWTANFMQH